MAVTTLASREFNQDTSRAKKAAQQGPVFITHRGRPAHVLLSIGEYPTAMVHGMTVVTRNVRDFEPMGVEILNPWEWAPAP